MREIKNRRKGEYSEQKKRMSRGKQHGKKEWLRFFSELKKKKKHHNLYLRTQMNPSRIRKKKSIYRFSAVKLRTSKTNKTIKSTKETIK